MISAIADNWIQIPGPGASDGHYLCLIRPLSVSQLSDDSEYCQFVWSLDTRCKQREERGHEPCMSSGEHLQELSTARP